MRGNSTGLAISVLALLVAALPARAAKDVPEQMEGIDVENRLGESIDPELGFVDHEGNPVQLGDYFGDERPVLLTLNYFSCETLCSTQLKQVAKTLSEMSWTPGGEQFRTVTVSFDPDDTPEDARHERDMMLKHVDEEGAEWAFLTGEQKTIDRLTEQLGYRYEWNEESEQYAHSPVVYVIAPPDAGGASKDGQNADAEASGGGSGPTISRTLFGLSYDPQDVRFALIDASKGEIGSTFDKVLMSCFKYSSDDGEYTAFAFGIMRLGAVLTVLVLGTFLTLFWMRERRQRRRRARLHPQPAESTA